jgi:cyanophycin synthetase
MDPLSRGLLRLSRLGKPGAFLGLELDLARALGPRLAWSRLRRPPAPGESRTAMYHAIWRDAADRVGAAVEHTSGPYAEIRRGRRRIRLYEGLVELDDPVTLALAGDKPLAHELLLRAGLTVPEHVVGDVADTAEAVAFAVRRAPVVLKPARATGRGEGVTGGVVRESDVARALLRAARFDPSRFLVERQLEGPEYRVLVLDREVVGVVRRGPPHVTGDGRSSVAELVQAENARRRGVRGTQRIELDLDAVLTLRRQGMTPRTVPPWGTRARVRTGAGACAEHEARALDVGDAELDDVSPVALAAAAALGSAFCSVELIVPDDGGEPVVLEVNTTPGLAQHYAVANPESAPAVAAAVLERLLTRRR